MSLLKGNQSDDLTLKYLLQNAGGGGGGTTIEPATEVPLMDSVADVGSSEKYAREDHIHPTDTSKADLSDFKAFTITLSSSSWSSNQQTVSNANFLASGYAYIVSPSSSNFSDYTEAQIYADDVSTDGYMTFHCDDVPTSNLTVNIVMVVTP